MAEGCISVVEMTVPAKLVQQHAGHWVVFEGKKLPRLDVSKAGQGACKIGAMFHRALQYLIDQLDALADPAYVRHAPRVAQRFVARAVRALVSGLAVPRNVRVAAPE